MLSAIAKLSSMESFELYVFSFGFASFDLCSIAARAVIILEFLTGASLASGIYFKLFRNIGALSLGLFSIFLIWRFLVGDTDSCHCMGDIVDMNPIQSLVKNLVLGIILIYVWNCPERYLEYCRPAAAIATLAAVISVFAINPPDAFYRHGRVSNDLVLDSFSPVADSLSLSEGKKIVCFYSASCEHCKLCAQKMSGIIRRHEIPVDNVKVIFMQTHADQDSVSLGFFREHGGELILPYSYLHPYDFIPLTNGSMPLVVLMEDGKLVKEYDYLSLDENEIAGFLPASPRQ